MAKRAAENCHKRSLRSRRKIGVPKPDQLCSGDRGMTGMSRVNVAPLPRPSLLTRKEPPSCRAVAALLCSPNPWPSFLVVNPCEKMRSIATPPIAARRDSFDSGTVECNDDLKISATNHAIIESNDQKRAKVAKQ